jgi:nucleotide-binding universal stress UspA family protein
VKTKKELAMKELDRILVAVDFGTDTQFVIDAAVRLAQTFDAKLRLIYVIEEVPHFPAGLELLKEGAGKRLAKLHDDVVSRGVTCDDPLCVVGRSFDAIVRNADRLNARLIVMGRGATKSMTGLGTTISRVIRRAARPVLAVGQGTEGSIRRILCPVDGSNPSACGLRIAILLARRLAARLTVMTVIGEFSPGESLGRLPDIVKLAAEYQKMEREQFDRFIQGFDFSGVTWDKEVHYGHPATEIIRLATDAKYDLVVMGSTGRSGLPRILLGSTAENVARRVPCSILTVKRDDVLSARLEADLGDLNRLVSEGQSLLEKGQFEEAIGRFDQCLLKDPYLATAIDGLAAAHEGLGHHTVAVDLREQANLIRRELWHHRESGETMLA